MADNVQLNNGAGGEILATDQVPDGPGNPHFQLVKLVNGASNQSDRIGGDTANGLDVDVTRIQGTVATVGQVNSGVDIGDVTVNNTGNAPVPIADNTDALYGSGGSLTPKFAPINVSAAGDTVVVAAVVGKKIRVLKYKAIAGGAVTVRWYSGLAGTPLTGPLPYAANGGEVESYCPVGHFETAVNAPLVLNLGGAVAVGGCLTYLEV